MYNSITICTHITSTSQHPPPNPVPKQIPKFETSIRFFSGTLVFTHTSPISGSQRSTKSHLFSHTIQRPNSENLQECSRVLTSTLSTNLQNPVPKQIPKSETSLRIFQKPFPHTSPISGSQRSTKSHLCSHTIQRPNSENLQECSRVLTSTLSTNLHKPRSPNRSPNLRPL
jgi:hypothetical protein